eukprot:CAMPEP_0198491262 /NCGR_PEP_ID=MMETSP1462-20131121/2654_1 /TAXON_ID=1333877 /ORGANISM="Brandtodinium nutriculum, Strain RCC3387" /LENGTH=56 /DNA_ID=CAMNT_0044219851 /DNA_START=63 /DNA_END=229 /DNA_ORIENTATION=-
MACSSHGNCCDDYMQQCGAQPLPAPAPAQGPFETPGIMTLYHTTSPEIAELILKGG